VDCVSTATARKYVCSMITLTTTLTAKDITVKWLGSENWVKSGKYQEFARSGKVI